MLASCLLERLQFLLTLVISSSAPLTMIAQIAVKHYDNSTFIAFIFVLFCYSESQTAAGIKPILMRIEICHTEPIMKIANMT
jgi:hypothetical protein